MTLGVLSVTILGTGLMLVSLVHSLDSLQKVDHFSCTINEHLSITEYNKGKGIVFEVLLVF